MKILKDEANEIDELAVTHKLGLEILTFVTGKFSDFPCVLELIYSFVFPTF